MDSFDALKYNDLGETILSSGMLEVLKRVCVDDITLARNVLKVFKFLPYPPRRWFYNTEQEFPLVAEELRREENFLVQTQLDQINAVPFYPHKLHISKSRASLICSLNAYLVKDISSIVVGYYSFNTRFTVGMHLAVKDTVHKWYISEIKNFCLVGSIAFVLVSYLTWAPNCDEWILCTSSRLKSLYDSKGDLVQTILFISPIVHRLNQLPKQQLLTVFDVYFGEWRTDTVQCVIRYLSAHTQIIDSYTLAMHEPT